MSDRQNSDDSTNLTAIGTEISEVSPEDTPDALPLRDEVRALLDRGGALAASLPGYTKRSPQIEMARRVSDAIEAGDHVLIEAGTGTGKALDVDTPIPTPTGWKRMGDLAVGDMVFDEAGRPTCVIAAFDVMHDRKCYEIVFTDGSKIVADAEHQWVSYTHADRKWAGRPRMGSGSDKNYVTQEQLNALDHLIAVSSPSEILSASEAVALIGGHHWSVGEVARSMAHAGIGKMPARFPRQLLLAAVRKRLASDLTGQRRDSRSYSVVTTEQMARSLTVGAASRANHAVPVAGALVLPQAELPIDPYFLGVWLGDGSSRSNQITSADPEILAEIERAGYSVRSLASHPYLYAVDDENGKAVSRWQPGMTGRLRSLSLRLNKHIPDIYLRASVHQRQSLLAGLLDTDGTVSRHGAIEYTTTSAQLAEDVYELACTLGFRPYVRRGRAKLNGKDCGPKWTIAFTTNQPVFRLPRKLAAQRERLRKFTPERNRFRYVTAINEIPSRPVRCIQVEAPSHLYLAGRSMIPTHNSLAYLLPIVRSGKVAIVSTANKALQEQLFYKDIPFIQDHIQPFEAALVKGMGNYLCLDRLESERSFQQIVQNPAFAAMEAMMREPDELDGPPDNAERWDGDLDLLPVALPNSMRASVNAVADECAWRDCPHFGPCYVRRMRDHAREAQVIVVNHTLLLLDAAMGGFLLPERDVIIIDEAHHLEEEATRAFTVTVTPGRVKSLMGIHRFRDNVDAGLYQDALAADANLWATVATRVPHYARGGRVTTNQPLQEGLRLSSLMDELATSLQRNRPLNMEGKEEQLYEKLVKRTRSLAGDLRVVFGVTEPDQRVYYTERIQVGRNRGTTSYAVSAAPLSVADLLREKVFEKWPVVATSATLAVGGSFSFFRERVGLQSRREKVLPLVFDYQENALLYVPRMVNEPAYGTASGPYLDELAQEMRALVESSEGRAFLLFSSQRALEAVLDAIGDDLGSAGYSLLVQGQELGRVELLRQFRKRPRAVLFGLKSFWEGVDVAGEALSLVVVDKLPFDPPDDPVHEARVNRMKAANQNWFGDYVLPQAILRLKQGLGRLLRAQEDRGVLAILDKRLYTKSYGRQVLSALPPARRTERIADVRAFFAEE